METNWAADHLQTIRTLMERSALYRRALAPVMGCIGGIGLLAGVSGCLLHIESIFGFTIYWLAIAVVALIAAFLLIRRQAFRDAEAFWSPPTRRIAQAMLPALTVGLTLGIGVFIAWRNATTEETTGYISSDAGQLAFLPPAWAVLYGCAIHAAGFFTPRGLRWFGWCLVVSGCGAVLVLVMVDDSALPWWTCHAMMSFFFGALHLAYGIYLSVTQSRKNES